MPDQYSQGKGNLVLPPYGSYENQWQLPCNSNFGMVDALLSGITTINASIFTSGSPTVTLVFNNFDVTTNQKPWENPLAGQNLCITVTGNLVTNATILIPSSREGLWVIDNSTTGSSTLSIKTTAIGSTGVIIPQGYLSTVFCDGTNVKFADLGSIYSVLNASSAIVPTGSIIAYGGITAPLGYLVCDGAAVSRTTYSALFSAIGTSWGVGDGATTFNTPGLVNQFLRGAGSSPVGTAETDTFKSHTHVATVADPGHIHGVPQGDRQGGGTGNYASGDDYTTLVHAYVNSQTATTGISVSNANTGDTETRPVNKRVLYIIKT